MPPVATMRIAVERLELTPEEEMVLWTLVASQLDAQLARRLEALSGGTEPTLGALSKIAYSHVPSRAVSELGPRGKLVHHGILESTVDTRAPQPPFAQRTVRLSDRMLSVALGSLDLDVELAETRIPVAAPRLDALAIGSRSLSAIRDAVRPHHALVVASGTPGSGRRTALLAAASERGLAVLEVAARKLAAESLRKQLRCVVRECKLLGRVPLITNLDTIDVEATGEELAALDGLVLATTSPRQPALRWGRPCVTIELEPPSAAQRGELWLRALGQGSASDAEHLATQYPLAPALITKVAASARANAGTRRLEPDDIYAALRSTLDARVGSLAHRVTVNQRWADIVLPDEERRAIRGLIARVRQRHRVYETWGFAEKVGRGLGVTALLSGPPGTGKTMAAGLIARELGLELYQVDVAKLVSKWVGETEKQLAELFDAAEAAHVILLFDEADALFGKRTEVKSSNDRYANLETNYLLQRLETYSGICLLTSNHETSIDPAFQRRLSLHVRFETPDADQRARLWHALLPPAAPLADGIDFEALSRSFPMSGGYIKNAVLRAAFAAADEGGSITTRHLEDAAQAELRASGRVG